MADALLAELLGGARVDRTPPHADRIRSRLDGMKAWVLGVPYHDHDSPEVNVVGDPMIIDAQGNKVHYYGPALLVNLNGFGVLTALEFVGVTKDRNYIGEVWRYELDSSSYKYRDFRDDPGVTKICTGEYVEGPKFRAGDPSWTSEACKDATPPQDFLKKFTPACKTFLINCRTGSFMQGPDFGALHGVLKAPVKVSQAFIESNASSCIHGWMQRAADMISEQSGHGHPGVQIQKVQLAQLAYGLTATMLRTSTATEGSAWKAGKQPILAF